MSDTVHPQDAQTVREDIAFMRNLAQEGARGPLFGGSILLATGLIYAAACTAGWYVSTRTPAEAGHWMTPILGSAVAAQLAVGIAIVVGLRRRGQGMRQASRSNRVFGHVWNAVGAAIFSCLASFALTAWIAHRPEVFYADIAVILALYGVGWSVTAAASNERWAWGVAGLSFLFAIGSGALVGNPNLLLMFAAALVLLLAAPGALLIKRASVRS